MFGVCFILSPSASSVSVFGIFWKRHAITEILGLKNDGNFFLIGQVFRTHVKSK